MDFLFSGLLFYLAPFLRYYVIEIVSYTIYFFAGLIILSIIAADF